MPPHTPSWHSAGAHPVRVGLILTLTAACSASPKGKGTPPTGTEPPTVDSTTTTTDSDTDPTSGTSPYVFGAACPSFRHDPRTPRDGTGQQHWHPT